jgi:hypothetical protein
MQGISSSSIQDIKNLTPEQLSKHIDVAIRLLHIAKDALSQGYLGACEESLLKASKEINKCTKE